MVNVRIDPERVTGQELLPALTPTTRGHVVRHSPEGETLELSSVAALVAAIASGAISPSQISLEDLIDAIAGDSGGDVNFTRSGGNLRGTVRDDAITAAKLAAQAAMAYSSVVTAFWTGTQAQYNAIASKSPTTLYLVE